MKFTIRKIIINSLTGIVTMAIAFPFLMISCLIAGFVVKMGIKVFMFGYNLF